MFSQDCSEHVEALGLLPIVSNSVHAKEVMAFIFVLPRLPSSYMWAGYRCATEYAEEKGVFHGPLKAFCEDYFKCEWLLKRTPALVSVYKEEFTATVGMESRNADLNKKLRKHPPLWDLVCE